MGRKKLISINLEQRLDFYRAAMSDRDLKLRYEIILYQCQTLGRGDSTLLKYINELEFRGLRYKKPKLGK